MSAKSDWRPELMFSDRMAVITKIADQLQNNNTHLDSKEARSEARNIEKSIYEVAETKVAYHEACQEHISGLSRHDFITSSQTEEVDPEDEPLSPSAVTIGNYLSATHHRDGLFSFVYKARLPGSSSAGSRIFMSKNALVALKVTTPSLMEEPHDSEREVRILESLRHDNIIPLLESFQQAGGRLVLVFPFMPFNLKELLRDSRLDHDQVRSHLQSLFSALAYLHGQGIIHRDVKPSNILLKSTQGPAYLADFGIAWSPSDEASEDPSKKITDVGTTSYRPPELLFGNTAYDCSLDLWAAGCVVAEATSISTKPLFDSGELGSELALIQSIFKSLGTPTLQDWPEAANFRDWGKMQFHEYPAKTWSELIPNASPKARDLVGILVRFESKSRMKAKDVLEHPYFTK